MNPKLPQLNDEEIGDVSPVEAHAVAIYRHSRTLRPALALTSDSRLSMVLTQDTAGKLPVRFPTLSAPVPLDQAATANAQLSRARSLANATSFRLSPYRRMQLPTKDGSALFAGIPAGFAAIAGLDVQWAGDRGWHVTAAKIPRTAQGTADTELIIPAQYVDGISGILVLRHYLQFESTNQDTEDTTLLTHLSAEIAVIPTNDNGGQFAPSTSALVSYSEGQEGDFSNTWTPAVYASPVAYLRAPTKDAPPYSYRFPLAGGYPTRHRFVMPEQFTGVLPAP